MTEPFKSPDFYGAAETDDERRRLAEAAENAPPEVQLQVTTTLRMRRWVQDAAAAPSLDVRCSSIYRKKPCRQRIGQVWNTPLGHYFRAEIRTSHDGRMAGLTGAMDMQDEGLPGGASLAARWALQESKEYDGSCELPLPGLNGGVLLGCRNHGRVAVYAARLAEIADTPRRVWNVEVHRKYIGYPQP